MMNGMMKGPHDHREDPDAKQSPEPCGGNTR